MGFKTVLALLVGGYISVVGSIAYFSGKAIQDNHDMQVSWAGTATRLKDVSTEERKILDNTLAATYPNLVLSGRLSSDYSFFGEYFFKASNISKDSLETIAQEVVNGSGLNPPTDYWWN